ncbi:MAG: hypothetical protein Q9201_003022 [Fulgogasparrea decipioides]
MGAVGQEFGDVLQEWEGSSERQSVISLDAGRLEETLESCRAVLTDIEASISKATKRIVTDPDYLNGAVEITKRERVAYGLTFKDLKLFSARIKQGRIDLRLQREKLVQEMIRTAPSRRDIGLGYDGE